MPAEFINLAARHGIVILVKARHVMRIGEDGMMMHAQGLQIGRIEAACRIEAHRHDMVDVLALPTTDHTGRMRLEVTGP